MYILAGLEAGAILLCRWFRIRRPLPIAVKPIKAIQLPECCGDLGFDKIWEQMKHEKLERDVHLYPVDPYKLVQSWRYGSRSLKKYVLPDGGKRIQGGYSTYIHDSFYDNILSIRSFCKIVKRKLLAGKRKVSCDRWGRLDKPVCFDISTLLAQTCKVVAMALVAIVKIKNAAKPFIMDCCKIKSVNGEIILCYPDDWDKWSLKYYLRICSNMAGRRALTFSEFKSLYPSHVDRSWNGCKFLCFVDGRLVAVEGNDWDIEKLRGFWNREGTPLREATIIDYYDFKGSGAKTADEFKEILCTRR